MIGRRVTLRDEGEGWFAGYGDISGTITSVIPASDGNPYYAIRFDPQVELQESGEPATPSGRILKRYLHCVIRSRWRDQDIRPDMPTSVHLALVAPGKEPPETSAQVGTLQTNLWASCVVS
jgi:hypothetical protein